MGSTLLWAATQRLSLREVIEGSGLFVLPAWQWLFVLGMIIGTHQDAVAHHLHGKRAPLERRLLLGFAAAIALYGFMSHEGWVPLPTHIGSWALTDRGLLGPWRVVNFAAWVHLIGRLMASAPFLFRLQWFQQLGRYSLWVFVWHLPAALLLKPRRLFASWQTLGGTPLSAQLCVALDLLVTGLVVWSLHLPTLLAARLRQRRTRSRALTVAGAPPSGAVSRGAEGPAPLD